MQCSVRPWASERGDTMTTTRIGIRVLCIALASAVSASAQQVLTTPEVNEAVQSDVSPPVGSSVLAPQSGASRDVDVQESRRPKLPHLIDAARAPSAATSSAPPRKAAAASSLP